MNRSAARILLVAAALASAASLLTCRRNNPPDTPVALNWPPAVWRDSVVEYRVVVSDIDGDEVAVRWEWSDSTPTLWQGWYPSGCTVSVTRIWPDTGQFHVRLQAKDRHDNVSWFTDYFTQMVILRRPPLAPSTPVGPAKGGVDSAYTFTTTANASGPSRVSIRFDWGNGDTSDWSELVAAGETVAMTHAWPVADTYAIRAMARDTGVVPSPWSSAGSFIVRPADTLRKWRSRVRAMETPDRSASLSPAIADDGTIYLASSDSAVYAFNPDGSLKWRYQTTNRPSYASVSIGDGGTVYIALDDTLFALTGAGTLRWQIHLRHMHSSVAIGPNGLLYVAAYDSLVAVDTTGSVRWSHATGTYKDYSYSSPVVGPDGTIYACTRDGYIYAFDSTGVPLWVAFNNGCSSSPAVGADAVYVPGDRVLLTALGLDGSTLWEYDPSFATYNAPVVGPDGTIYVGGRDNALHAVNPDGSGRWTFTVGDDVSSTPALAEDGTIYFGSDDSCFYALRPDGTLKWRHETGSSIRSHAAIAHDGTVFFVSNDGWLYALKGTAPLADAPWPKFQHDARNTGRAGAR